MLLDTYQENELLTLINNLGPAGPNRFAFRGDLVIELGDMHESSQTRNPPKKALEQAVMLVEGDKIAFLGGYLADIANLEPLVEKFQSDFAGDICLVVFCFNIDAPLQVDCAGVTIAVFPMESGLVWNELMDLFYVEKSDIKGQSPEEKVGTLADAKGELKLKGDLLALTVAAARSNGQTRQFVGPI